MRPGTCRNSYNIRLIIKGITNVCRRRQGMQFDLDGIRNLKRVDELGYALGRYPRIDTRKSFQCFIRIGVSFAAQDLSLIHI